MEESESKQRTNNISARGTEWHDTVYIVLALATVMFRDTDVLLSLLCVN